MDTGRVRVGCKPQVPGRVCTHQESVPAPKKSDIKWQIENHDTLREITEKMKSFLFWFGFLSGFF